MVWIWEGVDLLRPKQRRAFLCDNHDMRTFLHSHVHPRPSPGLKRKNGTHVRYGICQHMMPHFRPINAGIPRFQAQIPGQTSLSSQRKPRPAHLTTSSSARTQPNMKRTLLRAYIPGSQRMSWMETRPKENSEVVFYSLSSPLSCSDPCLVRPIDKLFLASSSLISPSRWCVAFK